MTGGTPMHYLDHAATSWPKPPEVIDAVVRAFTEAGGNPGRSSHALALAAARVIAATRSAAAQYLSLRDDRDLVFVPGTTHALNLVLKGSLAPGDRVVVGSMEHNAVVRPLAALARTGVTVEVVRADPTGYIDPDDVERAVDRAPTRAVICQHASNVTGTVQPVGDIADVAHAHGAVMIVDGAQAVGHLPVDLGSLGADAYACAGHKGLLGPQGVGLLHLAPGFDPDELIQGGGGSDPMDASQPSGRPDRYEAGTANTPGIAGLGAALEVLCDEGAAAVRAEQGLLRRLHEGLLAIPGLRVLGPAPGVERVPVVSVAGPRPSDEIAFALERRYAIAVRGGLHCCPWGHETVGTLPDGAVRFSLGRGVTEGDIDRALEAMDRLASE